MSYLVGIDLGTTHSALAYVPASEPDAAPTTLPVPQLIARGTLGSPSLLPSFLYFASDPEPLGLPWTAGEETATTIAVGTYARVRGQEAPERVVSSAKSWLCHAGVDRRAPILPFGRASAGSGEPFNKKCSPVAASAAYLSHLAAAFFAATGEVLAAQTIVLTVPASFDAAARDLTLEAARMAGLGEAVTLLEEPQAALYAWTNQRGDAFRKELAVGDKILVVDVGGGTTDFSAIDVQERDGALVLERIAVGDHILLGGDNMDLLLGHVVAQKILATGKTLDDGQRASLVHACRDAKEKLLADAAEAAVPIALASRGSNLFGGMIRTELTRDEVAAVVLAGFFPEVGRDAVPVARPRAALTQLGLTYAQDAGITRHLAAFLARHSFVPTKVLFNGGPMKSALLRGRILEHLARWFSGPIAELPFADFDLAVARGAAIYGRAKRGRGVRIRGGTARSYYVGVESNMPTIPGFEPPLELVCVAPFGMEEGTETPVIDESSVVGVVVGAPVAFRFFSSTVRREDRAGQVIHEETQGVEELSPIEVTLPAAGRTPGDVVPVRLGAAVTELGRLALHAEPLVAQTPGARVSVELSLRSRDGDGTSSSTEAR